MLLAMLQRVSIVAALLVLTGCAGIARPGPAEMAITQGSADLAGFSLIDMNPQNVGDYLVRHDDDGAGTAGIPTPPPVVLSSGDVIKVRISESKEGGLFAPLATGGTVFDKVRVDHRGTISLPYAAKVKVSGLDTDAAGDRIRDKLTGVSFEPQVYVELVADNGSSVLIGGEVKNPGRFSLLEGPLTLLDAVGRAGGATRPAHQIDVVIRRGKQVLRVPLSPVESGRNMQLRSGDEVILQSDAKVFNALGAVGKAGQVEFSKANPSLLDALSQVGGLANELASNTGVFVFRLREPKAWQDGGGRWHEGPAIFRFNMSKPETMFIAQAFGIVPEDTIYVTNAPAVEWLRTIAPIAATMAAVNNTVNAGYRAGIITLPRP